ncbi:MAG: hypothetical protein OEQ39_02925 [Gammaproteobacteria bacterium]|nr:hypothetical protein [Gammaproteobacteria bacterium]MDH3375903.1 hypothetical protein [Gammaproteobacteria bacterium]
MPIHRTRDAVGNVVWSLPQWAMSAMLTIFIAWVCYITGVTWSNSIELGKGGRFTDADGVRLETLTRHTMERVHETEVLLDGCSARMDADRDERAMMRAQFDILRTELLGHKILDDQRFERLAPAE